MLLLLLLPQVAGLERYKNVPPIPEPNMLFRVSSFIDEEGRLTFKENIPSASLTGSKTVLPSGSCANIRSAVSSNKKRKNILIISSSKFKLRNLLNRYYTLSSFHSTLLFRMAYLIALCLGLSAEVAVLT